MIGNLVEETIDLMSRGLSEQAIVPAAFAVGETVHKTGETYVRFVKRNFEIIAFMGLPRASPLPLKISYQAKRLIPQLNVNADAAEITAFLVGETAKSGKMSAAFAFTAGSEFEVKQDKLLVPASIVFGVLGSVIFAPENRDERIGEKYWLNVGDFRMFVSEFWGRRDLVERIIRFYRD